jgi:hypothetical protein
MVKRLRSPIPGQYRIKVKEFLDATWSDRFDQMTISNEDGMTTLTGPLIDQAALFGVLIRIRDLNLNLLLVERIDPEIAENQ